MPKEVTSLTPEQNWERLAEQEFGRLAYQLDGRLYLVPINYAVDRRRLVFRTGPGNKLLACVGTGSEVVLEIDDIGDEHATSVLVRGTAHELPHEEAIWADQLRLRPWTSSEKHHVVAIEPTEVSGLRFRMHRPWLSMYPEL